MNEQVEAALKKANEVRFAVAKIRRDVQAGTRTVADLVLENPPELKNYTLYDLLTYQRRWKRFRTIKFLAMVQISETKKVGDLSPRQRQHIADNLRLRW